MFVSASFRPLLLIVRCSSIPLRSQHGPVFQGVMGSWWRPCSLTSFTSHRLFHPAPHRLLRRLLVAVKFMAFLC